MNAFEQTKLLLPQLSKEEISKLKVLIVGELFSRENRNTQGIVRTMVGKSPQNKV